MFRHSTTSTSGRKRHWSRWLYRIQWALLAVIFLAAVALRLKLLHYQVVFDIFTYAGLGALAMALVSMLVFLWGMVRRNGEARNAALWAMVLGLVPVAVPLFTVGQDNFRMPPIHDISTDLQDPPRFEAAISLRTKNDHSVEYPGEAVANQQRGEAAYQDIVPLQLQMTVPQATELANAVATELGWRVVTNSPGHGLLEAVDRTPILGFSDDIVVRIRQQGSGVRVDVRSASRVGVGDMGVNAERIRKFLALMRKQADAAQ